MSKTERLALMVANLPPREKSSRRSVEPLRFTDLKFVPGSNNRYTAGRKVDSFDRCFAQ